MVKDLILIVVITILDNNINNYMEILNLMIMIQYLELMVWNQLNGLNIWLINMIIHQKQIMVD